MSLLVQMCCYRIDVVSIGFRFAIHKVGVWVAGNGMDIFCNYGIVDGKQPHLF